MCVFASRKNKKLR